MTKPENHPSLRDALSLKSIIEKCRPDLQNYAAIYKKLHAAPELSHQESETAASIQRHFENLSDEFDIRTRIGGYGLIAVLRNGPGKTLLLRADMDALPVAERTGLEYSSQRKQIDAQGKETSVMHGKNTPEAIF